MGRRKNQNRRQQNRAPRWTGTFWLVVIDDEPLRRDAATACRRNFAKLKAARTSWGQFERHDRPAFDRWRAATFGAQLTELREITQRVVERAQLVDEVESESFFSGCSAKTAYQRIVHARHIAARRMARPVEQEEPRFNSDGSDESPSESEDPFDPDVMQELLKEELFREVLKKEMGIDPDRLPAKAYEAMFAHFKADVFGARDSSRREQGHPPPPPQPLRREPPRPPRLKELYRQLVRRLHPDTRTDQDPLVMHLWHEVQEAYAAGDVEGLETLQALTDLHEEKIGAHTAISQLRAALGEIHRALRALEKSLRAARQDPAWDFARLGPQPALQARLQRQIFVELDRVKRELAEHDALIAFWERPSPKRKKKKGEATHPGTPARYSDQTWMPF